MDTVTVQANLCERCGHQWLPRIKDIGLRPKVCPKCKSLVWDKKKASQSLYFVQCGNAVKIGGAVNVERRLKSLATSAIGPLRLLAVIEGAGAYELECHKRLAHLHIHGEWFRYNVQIEALIQEFRQKYMVSA